MPIWPIPFNIHSADSSSPTESQSYSSDLLETNTDEPASLTCDEINHLADRLIELQDQTHQRLQRLTRQNPDLTSEDIFD